MATELLLMENVPNLGNEGDVVNVADGYARNYLVPKKIAEKVTAAARARLAKLMEQRAEERKLELAGARALADKLAKASCTITVKTGEDDKLYGSVNNADIAKSLSEQGIEIDRHIIVVEEPIKELGVFDVKVKLHADVNATVKVWIVGE
ncbi:MAG: 50S ribosomal protein L9 [Kiritimatiellae bacterium]|nr:50S ribosomal protein L9 [Kiritimatiellia bacterium]